MKTKKVLSFICIFCLLLSSIISIIDSWCFNREFYKQEYSSLNTAEYIGMSNNDLEKTTNVLLSYLKDKNLTLDVECKINGNNRQVFNERERAHMVDVRDLYLNVMTVRDVCLIIFALCAILIILKKDLSYIYKEYKKVLLVFVFIFSMIGIACAIDFNTFWTSFHHIFFAGNDLWLLDPSRDILIMMVPSKFFFDLCVSIIFTIFVVLILYTIIFKILDKRVFSNDKRRFI